MKRTKGGSDDKTTAGIDPLYAPSSTDACARRGRVTQEDQHLLHGHQPVSGRRHRPERRDLILQEREKKQTIKALANDPKTNDREALKETYREVALKVLPGKLYPTLQGIPTILDEYAKRFPKAKTMRPEDFVDSSFVKKLDDEGFFERLYIR